MSDWRVRHGHFIGNKPSLTYSSWDGMLGRCLRKGNASYKNYGGRGITVCKRWLKFENFLADMGERPSKDHQLERKKNNLGYTKSNCRWATRSEQARNRKSNRLLTLDKRTMTASDWADELKWPVKTIWVRKSRGWTDMETLTTPRRIYPVLAKRKLHVQH